MLTPRRVCTGVALVSDAWAESVADGAAWRRFGRASFALAVHLGLYPIVTLRYSSATSYQVSDHIQ
jgi:hypothetical protein